MAPPPPADRAQTLAILADALGVAPDSLEGAATRALASISNRNVRVEHGGAAYVVRLPGPAAFVDRAVEGRNARAAAALGIGPGLVLFDAASGAMVTEAVAGARPLAARDLRDPATLTRIARTLRRLHEGAGFAGRLDPAEKIARYAKGLRGLARREAAAALALVPAALVLAAEAAASGRLAPCHNDPVPDNLLDDGSTVTLVDWEYAGLNDPLWDLAYLAVEGGLDAVGEEALLAAYGEAALRPRFAMQKALCTAVSALWAVLALAEAGPSPGLAVYAAERLAHARALLESPPRPGGRAPSSAEV
jgi:thiamine kinase-like enzyme